MKHDDYVESIKKAAVDTGTKVLTTALTTKLPFLAWGPLGGIVGIIVGKLVNILVNQTEFGLFFLYIDMRTDAQGKKFSEAAAKNYHAQMKGTPEEKIAAEKELIENFREFITLGA